VQALRDVGSNLSKAILPMSRLVLKLSSSDGGRWVVYAADLIKLTGRCYRTCCKILRDVRKKEGKPPHHLVTIAELCRHTGFREDVVYNHINRK